MVVIQTDRNDHSTNDVLDWIFYFNNDRQVCRINDVASIRSMTYRIGRKPTFQLSTDQCLLEQEAIRAYWYRRGRFSFHYTGDIKTGDTQFTSLADKFIRNVDHDKNVVLKNLLNEIAKVPQHVNKPADAITDKIENLKIALSCGLSIPETIITNDIEQLSRFAAEHSKIITKSIDYSLFTIAINDQIVRFSLDTALISESQLSSFSATYHKCFCPPALFQQYIEKKIELRIFYLNGELFPMAIFSQASEQTKLDFRNYDIRRPNRTIPFRVSAAIENKLILLMRHLEFDSGSIDMILTPDGDYYFLEVNPIGRYQWLAKNCNYPIDRKIAEILTS